MDDEGKRGRGLVVRRRICVGFKGSGFADEVGVQVRLGGWEVMKSRAHGWI